MKYYLQQNARNVPVQVGDFKIQFEQVAFIASTWWGIFATDNADVQAALAEAISKNRMGISEVNQEQFDFWAKKKNLRTHTWSVMESVLDHRPPPQAQPEKSADSATTDTDESDPENGITQDRPMEELLKTAPREDANGSDLVTSQAALAEALEISLPKLQKLAKTEGNPGKSEDGYSISKWRNFLDSSK